MNYLQPFMPIPPPYTDQAGIAYAQKLARPAQFLSYWLTIFGWSGVVAGTFFALLATVLSASTPIAECLPDIVQAQPGVFSAALGVFLGGVGWQLIDRAFAASKVAIVATRAIQLASAEPLQTQQEQKPQQDPDRVAYNKCIEAKAAWLEGRRDNARLKAIVSSFK